MVWRGFGDQFESPEIEESSHRVKLFRHRNLEEGF